MRRWNLVHKQGLVFGQVTKPLFCTRAAPFGSQWTPLSDNGCGLFSVFSQWAERTSHMAKYSGPPLPPDRRMGLQGCRPLIRGNAQFIWEQGKQHYCIIGCSEARGSSCGNQTKPGLRSIPHDLTHAHTRHIPVTSPTTNTLMLVCHGCSHLSWVFPSW